MQVPNTAMKSLLKGLRYISQVFVEGEKEEEMQIGNPTDVKHVAHIGWDGPSASTNSTPSWMKDFKNSSTTGPEKDDSQSEGGVRSRDVPKVPKSTRKSVSEQGSPIKEKSEKSKRRTTRRSKETSKDSSSSSSQLSVGLPGLPKKSKRKKAKEARNNDGSTRSSLTSEVDKMSDYTSDTGSVRSMPQLDQDKDGF